MNIFERRKLAIKAYLNVLYDPELGPIKKFSPPIGSNWRDKNWSRELRNTWPDFASVEVSSSPPKGENRQQWCEENVGYYWHNSDSSKWYFDEVQHAMKFKLRFGGEMK